MIGDCAKGASAEAIIEAFMTALLQNPTEIGKCSLAVFDPEWEDDAEYYTPEPTKDSRNHYGWDGKRFLGDDNIREL
jgi:hypothetical protein